MVRRMQLLRQVAAALMLAMILLGGSQTVDADVRFEIKSTYTGPEFVAGVRVTDEISFVQNQIEDILVGWRGPQSVETRYDGLDLDISVVPIDGPGNVLAFAGPTRTIDYGAPNGFNGALADEGIVRIDEDDIAAMIIRDSFRDTLMHEMFHAIGSGTLWERHGLVDSTGFAYTGSHALDFYQRETGDMHAGFVPLETGGGPGTAGGHWEDDDPYFVDRLNQRQEINTGTDFGFETFISNVTLASFRDIGYLVPSLGGDEYQFGGGGLQFPGGSSTKPEGDSSSGDGNQKEPGSEDNGPLDGGIGGGDEPIFTGFSTDFDTPVFTDGSPSAVPEPSSAIALLGFLAGIGMLRSGRR